MVKPKLWQNYSMLGDLSFTGRGESIYGGYGFGCVNIYDRTWDPVCHFPENFVCLWSVWTMQLTIPTTFDFDLQ